MDTPEPTPHEHPASRLPISLTAWVPITLALLTPLLYLNGKAFYEGHLTYLHLNTTMFPQDTADTMMSAVTAWLSVSIYGLPGIERFLELNWKLALLIVISVSLGVGTLNWGLNKLALKLENVKLDESLPSSAKAWLTWLQDILNVSAWLFLPVYGFIVLTLIVTICLFFLLFPFLHLGKQHAANQLEKGFVTSPLVRIANPEGLADQYRVVECSARFCALYAEGQMITVPLSAITWAVSDLQIDSATEERSLR